MSEITGEYKVKWSGCPYVEIGDMVNYRVHIYLEKYDSKVSCVVGYRYDDSVHSQCRAYRHLAKVMLKDGKALSPKELLQTDCLTCKYVGEEYRPIDNPDVGTLQRALDDYENVRKDQSHKLGFPDGDLPYNMEAWYDRWRWICGMICDATIQKAEYLDDMDGTDFYFYVKLNDVNISGPVHAKGYIPDVEEGVYNLHIWDGKSVKIKARIGSDGFCLHDTGDIAKLLVEFPAKIGDLIQANT